MNTGIHPTAVVDPAAALGPGTRVGAFAVIGPKVALGADCVVGPHCVLENVKAGDRNVFTAHVSAGTAPQDLTHKGEDFFVVMGNGNTFREYVTLNRGTKHDTLIGNDCFLMTCAHVAHDCKVGNNVIMANAAVLGGHSEVGDRAFLGGLTAVHQFARVGTLAMIGGVSGVAQDLPPYCMTAGRNQYISGLNLVGLRRAGIPRENISRLREAFKVLFLRGLRLEEALAQLRGSPVPEVRTMVEFIAASKRGTLRARAGVGAAAEEVEA